MRCTARSSTRSMSRPTASEDSSEDAGAMERLSSAIVRVMTLFAGVGLVLMMLQVNADVAGRYLFTMPVPLTMELVTYYYMTLVAFLPLMALERKPGGLIHDELFYGFMPTGLRRWVFTFAM